MQRISDVTLSFLALIIFTPVLVPVVIALKFTGEGEIFYTQQRVGKNGSTFSLLKFATMLKNSPQMGSGTITVKDDPRVLPIGKILRKTKINELPQLINVIRGDMSLIGPRPLTPQTFDAYNLETKKIINTVVPGLSGVGSIVFRHEEQFLNNAEDAQSFYINLIAPYKGKLEVWYVENRSFKLYLYLILMTMVAVLFSRGDKLWGLFPTLPKPSKELLNKFYNFK